MSTPIRIRSAGRDDVAELARLLSAAGQSLAPDEALARLARLEDTGLDQVLVAEAASGLLGLLALHMQPVQLHRPGPAARVSVLVAEGPEARAALLDAAADLARAAGAAVLEGDITNN
ncbi:MAG TPA: hypothetical protein VFS21_15790 [Roseiflexaceae bacterium]|nr:hypothetical protein [Roseiflexaceae bacterium]